MLIHLGCSYRFLLQCVMLFALAMQATKIAQANDLPVLKALTNEDSYPYNYLSKNQISGLVYDIVKTLSARSGYVLQAEALPWTRALQTARDNPGIMVFSLARNAERENSYYWIGPVTTSEVWLFKLKNALRFSFKLLRI